MEFSVFTIFVATTLAVVCSPGPAAICAASQGAGNGVPKASPFQTRAYPAALK